MIALVLMILAITSGVSWLAAYCLARFGRGTRFSRAVLAGLLPTILIIVALVIGHILWLQHGGSPQRGYSPLAFLIYGFWMLPLILISNFAISFWMGRAE